MATHDISECFAEPPGTSVVALGGSWVHGMRGNPLPELAEHLGGGQSVLTLGGTESDANVNSYVWDSSGADRTGSRKK